MRIRSDQNNHYCIYNTHAEYLNVWALVPVNPTVDSAKIELRTVERAPQAHKPFTALVKVINLALRKNT